MGRSKEKSWQEIELIKESKEFNREEWIKKHPISKQKKLMENIQEEANK